MRYLATIEGTEHEFEVEELPAAGTFRVRLGGRELEADVRQAGPAAFSIIVGHRVFDFEVVRAGGDLLVVSRAGVTRLSLEEAGRRAERAAPRMPPAGGRAELRALMPGRVVMVLVQPGDAVQLGQGVVVIEAMKMENELKAPKAGKVAEVRVAAGQPVEKGELLAVIG